MVKFIGKVPNKRGEKEKKRDKEKEKEGEQQKNTRNTIVINTREWREFRIPQETNQKKW